MNAHILAIDMVLAALRLLSRLRIGFDEVKALYDQEQATGEPVPQEAREALAQRARDKIDLL